MFAANALQQINQCLETSKHIVILSHHNPDGDAIGSSLGLQLYLKNRGIEATVMVPNDFPKFLKWMPQAKKIVIADYKKHIANTLMQQADLIFCLDFNHPSRINALGPLLLASKATKILIDHHQSPDAFDFVYSDTSIPATCQMVYQWIMANGHAQYIDSDVAQCLYTGVMTDTGGFRFRSTGPETHRMAAHLIEAGAEPADITSQVLDTNSLSRLRLLGLILDRIELAHDGQVAILFLKRHELKTYGFEKGDTEGFVNYGLSILGVKIAAFFMEDLQEDFIKISFRSKNDADVNAFSRAYFNGGGHINAAGGRSDENLEATLHNFKSKLSFFDSADEGAI
jgi:bifunctional oligoribonuclease and PAP phosphatase NrnA